MAVTEKTARVPARKKVHRARVCCLQSIKSAPGCKGVLPITSREEEHSNDIQLVDDMTQGDIFDQLSISLKHPLQAVSCPPDVEKEPMLKAEAHSVSYDPQGPSSSSTVIAGQRTMPTRKIVHDAPLPSGVSRTPAGRFCTISIEARGAAEPQPTEGGSALRSQVEKSNPQPKEVGPCPPHVDEQKTGNIPSRKEMSDDIQPRLRRMREVCDGSIDNKRNITYHNRHDAIDRDGKRYPSLTNRQSS